MAASQLIDQPKELEEVEVLVAQDWGLVDRGPWWRRNRNHLILESEGQ